jgi:hypothetical protein
MKRFSHTTLLVAVAAIVILATVSEAFAGGSRAAQKRYTLRSQGRSWHSGWYDPSVGRPMALVVPPTAEFMSQYSWGVPSTRVTPLYHQYSRPYPGAGALPGTSPLLPTPPVPSDTVQFGVSPVRGPW